MLKSNEFLAGKCLPIFVGLDFRVGLRIFKIGATDLLVLLIFFYNRPGQIFGQACPERWRNLPLGGVGFAIMA